MFNALNPFRQRGKNHVLENVLFEQVILKYPKWVLACILTAVVFFGFGAKHFRLDASAETLVLENDQDLRYSRNIDSRYGGSDLLVLTFGRKGISFQTRYWLCWHSFGMNCTGQGY
jgi:hypothetical protein